MSYTFIQILHYNNLLEWDVKRYIQEDIVTSYELKPLSSLLQREKKVVYVEENQDYKQVKIRLYGKGICLRGTKKGKQIKTKKQYVIRQGQLLCSRIDARHGAFGIVPQELDGAIVTGSFTAFKIDEKVIDPLYLTLVCTSTFFMAICGQKSSGTTERAFLNHDALLGIKIPIPPLAYQREIVTDYYDKIRKANELEMTIMNLEERVKALLASSLGIDLLPKRDKKAKKLLQFFDCTSLVNGWGIYHLAFELTSSYYPMYAIRDLCRVGRGNTPTRSVKEYYENGDIAWFKSGELTHDMLYSSEEQITEIGLRNRCIKLYPRNSLVIAIYGDTIGKTGKLGVVGTTNQACAILFDYDKRILVDFLWFYLQSQTDNLKKMAYGSTQANLNLNMIRDYLIPLPPLDKQKEIVDAIKQIKFEIEVTKKEAAYYREIAKKHFEQSLVGEFALNTKLMTGVI